MFGKYFKGKSNKTLVKYLFSSFLSVPVSLIIGFISFRYIDPYFLGIWTALTIFENYATFLRLGVVNGMNRELPFALGAGKPQIANNLAQTTLAFTIFNIVLLFVLAPFIISNFELNLFYIVGIIICVVRIGLSFYITYLTGTFRSDDNFNKLSSIQGIVIFIKLVLCPLVLLGFYGFLAYELLIVLSNAVLLHYFRPFRILPKFHLTEFKQLIKIGLPLFVKSYLLGFIETLPSLYIIKESGEKNLGLYAPALMLLGTVAILPNTLLTYMYPKFSFHFGQSKNVRDIWRKLLKIYLISFIFIIISVVIGFFLLDYFVDLFPKYKDSLPYLKISLIICPFIFFKMGNLINEILKKYTYMIYFVAIYGVVQITSILIVSKYNSDVIEVALYSQVITAILVLLSSLIMNYTLIVSTENKLHLEINKTP